MIYDVNTKNKSFLKMSKYLRDHNIKNNKFMLTLYDETLVGVDPYSPDLTMDQKTRIYTEICTNIWYYIREVARVTNGQPGGCMFRLILGTLAQLFTITFNLNYILILPRQVGKTIAEVQYSLWSTMFASNDSTTLYFNKDFTQSKKNLQSYKAMRDLLPKWLKEMVMSKEDVDNSECVAYASNGNRIEVKGSATSVDGADKLGRGCTAPNIYADEFGFLTYNDTVYNAFYPAWKTASENAKIAGSPTGIHITTTPNNLDENTPGAFCYSMIQAACKFEIEMYDLADMLIDFVHQNSDNDYVYIVYDYKECGKTDEWLAEVKREMNINIPKNKRKFEREYLLKWTLSNDSSVFTEDQLVKIEENIHPAIFHLNINNYRIAFYEQPDITLNYIISSDTAQGLGLDNSVLLFIHPLDFHIVGLFKSSNIDTASLRRLIELLMTVYFPNSVLNMERNMSGLAILEELVRNPKLEPRIYQERRTRTVEKIIDVDGKRVHTRTNRIEYGVSTDTKTRELMMDLLPNIIDNEYDKIISPELYSEIKTLQYKKDKIEAMSGMHDDILMSYLITRYALVYEKCFRTRFKISSIPTDLNIRNESLSSGIGTQFGTFVDRANAFSDNHILEQSLFDQMLENANNNTIIGSREYQTETNNEFNIDWIFK